MEMFSVVERTIEKLIPLQSKARILNLVIFEREFVAIEFRLRAMMDMQLRAFRDDTLCETLPLFPQGLFPYDKT
jgi:hypothetical protein